MLRISAFNGHAEIVQALLDHGAKINQQGQVRYGCGGGGCGGSSDYGGCIVAVIYYSRTTRVHTYVRM